MEFIAPLAIALATFAGAFVQAASGFGFAIVATPVFLNALGTKSSLNILVALHIVQSAMLVPGLWRAAPADHLHPLLIGAAVGCPLGLALLMSIDLATLKLTAGIAILIATALLVLRERRARQADVPNAETDSVSLPIAGATGFLSGAMTALLVMPGPPLMTYLIGRSVGREGARALSLTFFAACYVVVLMLAIAFGGMSGRDWGWVAVLAPLVVAGTLAGQMLATRLGEGTFRTIVLALLGLSGIGAIYSALS